MNILSNNKERLPSEDLQNIEFICETDQDLDLNEGESRPKSSSQNVHLSAELNKKYLLGAESLMLYSFISCVLIIVYVGLIYN